MQDFKKIICVKKIIDVKPANNLDFFFFFYIKRIRYVSYTNQHFKIASQWIFVNFF